MPKKLTLKQFFRDASTGHMALQVIERSGKFTKEEICPVVAVRSKSVVIRRKEGDSVLDLNFSALIDYDGLILSVYSIGNRETLSRGPLMLKYKVYKI